MDLELLDSMMRAWFEMHGGAAFNESPLLKMIGGVRTRTRRERMLDRIWNLRFRLACLLWPALRDEE